MRAHHYRRYVALGDSQTEGLWDGDDSAGLQGFADRLAAELDALHPGLAYANLAVRGRRIRDVLDEQLPAALAMHPDLVTLCVGMNDVTRPGLQFEQALADLDEIYRQLAASGATVVTTTFPDVTKILMAGRVIQARLERINDTIRAAAQRHGFRLVDLYSAESMSSPDVWAVDQVHGSPKGHALFAAAAAEALNLPGSNHDWAALDNPVRRPSLASRGYSQLLWAQNMLMPWLWRHLRHRSVGDGRSPKRPELQQLCA
jgi:lysophospholipase L1-like esterase